MNSARIRGLIWVFSFAYTVNSHFTWLGSNNNNKQRNATRWWNHPYPNSGLIKVFTVQNRQYARLSKVSRVQLFKASLTCWISYHFTTLWANSTEDKLMIFSLFSENRIWHLMQIVSRQFALNVKSCFLKNKNISKCRLLKFFYPEC